MIKNNDQLQLKRDTYQVLEFLGSGGQGIVWKVRRQSDSHECALKCVNIYQQEQLFKKHRKATEIKDLVVRAKEEIDFLQSLGQQAQQHYIVACIDHGVYSNHAYGDLPVMVMPLYQHDLEAYSHDYHSKQQSWPFTIDELLKWMQQAANALAFIHQHHNEQQPHVHRDIKLANLMLDAQGNIGLTDFGIARAMSHIGTSSVVASYYYCAPEQRFAIYHKKNFHKQYRITPAADCYSLGIAIHELIAGSTRAQDQISDKNKVDAHNGQLLPAGKKNSQKIGLLGKVGGLTANEKSYVQRQIKALINPTRQTLVTGIDYSERLANDFAHYLNTILAPWLEDRPNAVAIRQWCAIQQQALQAQLDVFTLVMQTPTVTDGEQAQFSLSIKGQGLHQSMDWLTLLINEAPTDDYQCTGIEKTLFGYLQTDSSHHLQFRYSLPDNATNYTIRLVADIGQYSKSVEAHCELRFSADHLWQLGRREEALQQELREEWLDILEQEAQNSSRKRSRLLDLLEHLDYDLADPQKKARYERIDQVGLVAKPKRKIGRLLVGFVLLGGLLVGAYQLIQREKPAAIYTNYTTADAAADTTADATADTTADTTADAAADAAADTAVMAAVSATADAAAAATAEPEMIPIPAGDFKMGCVSGKSCEDNEKPVHTVSIKAFDMAKTEVTFEQWDACVKAKGCSHKPDDKRWGRGKRPVINVSWDDAQQYVKWLSKETKKNYRLPTEAEWEYAARAGTGTKYSWGNEKPSCSKTAKNGASHSGDKKSDCYYKSDDKYRGTELVASYTANPWGLYDMHGNVWEWTCSAVTNKYDGSEGKCINENANDSDYQPNPVLRGGSWSYLPFTLRSANRDSNDRDRRNSIIGFRIARTR